HRDPRGALRREEAQPGGHPRPVHLGSRRPRRQCLGGRARGGPARRRAPGDRLCGLLARRRWRARPRGGVAMEPNWALAGELLLAASGLWPTDPLTRDTAEEAEKLPKAWAEEMRALLEGKPKRKPKQAPAIRYLATWKRLNVESDSEPLVAQLLDGRIAGAFKAVRDR